MPSIDPPLDTSADIPPFPSPNLFSILPEIYLLIARLEPLQESAGPALPTTPGGNNSTAPIMLQELPAAIQPIKTQILKAKAAVQALPDVERTVEEQEAEIRMLEGRIGGLRKRLGELGALAGDGGRKEGDVVMEGVED
jgi:RNA polymerase II transcription mediator complex subunit 9